ncbi:2'-5' RNA ligase [Branchiibius hedensis]|uniref:2'-5' RNA ligase n=1 Tax=Branchiibius hedensis TaxID=672460 RepID=A0A2Y8ZTV2_9MICO|nr:2'-5' RNA ligase family protein [Branchiibius hedensis]PWJ26124.1 2'-5' RNA ligase [Branchiibius hedensis]SSA34936.1 2'-5' RNA ligase [Branchiibius hedensis]
MRTIGVALAIPEPGGRLIADARARAGDPLAHAIPTHITLLPPTNVAGLDLVQFAGHLAQVARGSQPFRVVLEGTGTFRPISSVVFVQVSEGVAELARLQAAIRRGPVERPLDFPYHPHVTLAHDVSDAALDEVAAEFGDYRQSFVASEFDLYEQDEGGSWESVRPFPLG